MASISSVSVTLVDTGTESTPGGFNPVVKITVTVAGVATPVTHVLDGTAALGLTAVQVTNFQNQVNIIRGKAITAVKAAFSIP